MGATSHRVRREIACEPPPGRVEPTTTLSRAPPVRLAQLAPLCAVALRESTESFNRLGSGTGVIAVLSFSEFAPLPKNEAEDFPLFPYFPHAARWRSRQKRLATAIADHSSPFSSFSVPTWSECPKDAGRGSYRLTASKSDFALGFINEMVKLECHSRVAAR